MRNLFCIFVAGAWICLLFPFTLLLMLFTWSTDSSIWVARKLWAPVLLWAGGARLTVIGREHVDPRRPTLYVSNHQSTIDIPALFVALPTNLRFVAKKQLRWVPVLGWYLWIAKHVFIDRKNHLSAIASLEDAGRQVRQGLSIIVYPEGTRSPDGRVLPFKKGPFALALKARVPICPVTIEGSGRLMPKNRWTITPGEIKVMIGAPIDVTAFGEDQRDELVRRVRDQIIDQSVQLGGEGGDKTDAIAARGLEGIGAAQGSPA
ncbi:MAG: lysophospholipid acyltransferase family protein [Myxococcota bacterium]